MLAVSVTDMMIDHPTQQRPQQRNFRRSSVMHISALAYRPECRHPQNNVRAAATAAWRISFVLSRCRWWRYIYIFTRAAGCPCLCGTNTNKSKSMSKTNKKQQQCEMTEGEVGVLFVPIVWEWERLNVCLLFVAFCKICSSVQYSTLFCWSAI